ncbi:hypothetical protein [Dysgonomonas sp. 520]|uniref:hypothetical protein n=1 Tax=Dysgonomonas sp. 520 TaxID=2302931 RepID=UPI0013D1B219|nr:hypothetical protein [Dysgonomonas sp. 520]
MNIHCKLIFFAFLLLPVCSFSQGKNIQDKWYTLKFEDHKGYMHYVVNEYADEYEILMELRMAEGGIFAFDAKITNEKDSFLTTKTARIDVGKRNYRHTLVGTVKKLDNSLLQWEITADKIERIITSEYPTVDMYSSFFLLTKLNYHTKGKILNFNMMDIKNISCDNNVSFEYTEDEKIQLGNKNVLAKKVVIEGYGSNRPAFWLNNTNEVVKIRIDDIDMILCKKEDINLNEFQ